MLHTNLAAYDCKMRFSAGTMFPVGPVTDGWQTPRLRQVCHTIIYGLPCGDSGVFRAAGTIASNSPIKTDQVQGNGASLDIALNISGESWRQRRRRRRPSGPLSAPFVACRVAAVTANKPDCPTMVTMPPGTWSRARLEQSAVPAHA